MTQSLPTIIEKLDRLLIQISIYQKSVVFDVEQEHQTFEEREEYNYQHRINSPYYNALMNRADKHARIIRNSSRAELYPTINDEQSEDFIKRLIKNT